MATAKGIGGGFPLGACLATEKGARGMVIGSHGSRRLVITVDGKEYQNFVLTDQTNKQFTIETPYGYNEVVITNGVVDVVDADCENHVCVDTKPASKVFDKIVCLPHKLVIEIVGDGGETD